MINYLHYSINIQTPLGLVSRAAVFVSSEPRSIDDYVGDYPQSQRYHITDPTSSNILIISGRSFIRFLLAGGADPFPHPHPIFPQLIESLSSDVFEPRASTESGLLALLSRDFEQICSVGVRRLKMSLMMTLSKISKIVEDRL